MSNRKQWEDVPHEERVRMSQTARNASRVAYAKRRIIKAHQQIAADEALIASLTAVDNEVTR